MQKAHENKKEKYKCLNKQLDGLRPGGFRCDTLTLNWRIVVAESSYRELTAFNILKRKDFKIISSRTLIGGIATHNCFQRMTTSARKVKKGEG